MLLLVVRVNWVLRLICLVLASSIQMVLLVVTRQHRRTRASFRHLPLVILKQLRTSAQQYLIGAGHDTRGRHVALLHDLLS